MRNQTWTAAVLMFLLCGSAFGQNAVPRIKFPKNAPTAAVFCKQQLDFALHEIELYEKFSEDNPDAQKIAISFIRNTIILDGDERVTEALGLLDEKTLLADGEKLIKAGSQDPLVFRCFSRILRANKLEDRAKSFANKAVQRFNQSRYPQGLLFLYLDEVQRSHRSTLNIHPYQQNIKKALASQENWLRYGSTVPNGQQAALTSFNSFMSFNDGLNGQTFFPKESESGIDFFEHEQVLQVDPWLVEMARAHHYKRTAWFHRGNGFANTVTEAGWKKFRENSELAVKHYKNAYELAPERPEAASEMIALAAMGFDDDSRWKWFERCIAAEIDNAEAYTTILHYLKPQWGGSLEENLKFSEQCARSGRFDSDVPAYYMYSIEENMLMGRLTVDYLKANPKIYRLLKTTTYQLVDHPVHAGRGGSLSDIQSHQLNGLFKLAFKLRENADALELFTRLKDDEVFRKKTPMTLMESNLHARVKFDKQLQESIPLTEPDCGPDKLAKGLKIFQELLAVCDEPERLMLEVLANRVQKRLDYFAGEWVELDFDPELSSWNFLGDRSYWQTENENTIKASNIGLGRPMAIFSQSPFPGAKEIQVEIVSTNKPGEADGILVGNFPKATVGQLFWLSVKSRLMGIASPYKEIVGYPVIQKEEQKSYQLHVKVFPNYAELFVDGHNGVNEFLNQKLENIEIIGLGNLYWKTRTGEVCFRNFRVRKIDYKAPTGPADMEYLAKAIEKDPGKPFYYRQRSTHFFFEGEFETAYPDMEKAVKLGDLPSYLLLAICCESTGRYQRLNQVHEDATKILNEKTYPKVLEDVELSYIRNLATAPVDELRNGKLAVELAEKLVQKSGGQRGMLELVFAYAEVGQFDKARRTLEKLEKVAPATSESQKAARTEYAEQIDNKKPIRQSQPQHQDDGRVVD